MAKKGLVESLHMDSWVHQLCTERQVRTESVGKRAEAQRSGNRTRFLRLVIRLITPLPEFCILSCRVVPTCAWSSGSTCTCSTAGRTRAAASSCCSWWAMKLLTPARQRQQHGTRPRLKLVTQVAQGLGDASSLERNLQVLEWTGRTSYARRYARASKYCIKERGKCAMRHG